MVPTHISMVRYHPTVQVCNKEFPISLSVNVGSVMCSTSISRKFATDFEHETIPSHSNFDEPLCDACSIITLLIHYSFILVFLFFN